MTKKYWQDRQAAENAALLNTSIDITNARLQKMYLKTANDIVNKMTTMYVNIISEYEGNATITPNQIYSYKHYYEMLNDVYDKLDKLGVRVNKTMHSQLTDMYIDASKLTGKHLQEQGIQNSFTGLDERAEQASKKVWATDGKSWSTRVWNNTALLKMTIAEELTMAIATGAGANKLASTLQQRFSVSYSSAKRLAITELNHIYNESSVDRMKDADVDEYEWYTAEDEKVCPVCKKLDGKRFPITDKSHIPPAASHSNCRCTILAVIKLKNDM